MSKHVRQYQLDRTLLPLIESASIFTILNRTVEERLKATGILAETLNRVRGTVMLFHGVGDKKSWENEAYLRAGLSEFASIPDAHGRDLKAAGLATQKHDIRNSKIRCFT